MNVNVGYKLFEMDKFGLLHPLFIDKMSVVPVGKWIHGKFIPTSGFSPRGGWHLGANVPDAPWLKGYNGTDEGIYKSQRGKSFSRVWGECVYNANNDYNSYVQTLEKKAIVNGVPKDGFYFFKEVGKGVWIISSDIMVTRILTETERKEIMREKAYDEINAYASYKFAMEKRLANRNTN